MRTIAIIKNNKNDNDLNVQNLVDAITSQHIADKMIVFTSSPEEKWNTSSSMNVYWPADVNSDAKTRNWINAYFKTQQTNGFVHVIQSDTIINKDLNAFLVELENMMKILDYDVWMNTTCDRCNYVFNKHCSRFEVHLDDDKYKSLGIGDKLMFTSHCNTQWMAYNFDKVPDDLLRFDERFTVSMFMIIEFLARRRNSRRNDQLYYMNQYLTVQSEIGSFNISGGNPQNDISPEVMKAEDALFKSMNVNYAPDNNIDEVLEHTYEKMLSSKMI